MAVATGYGSGLFPNGTDFPFVSPSSDIRGLFEDMHLSYSGNYTLPLKVTEVVGFNSGNPSVATITITDAEDDVVFSTLDAIDSSNSSWGSNRIVYSWTTLGAVLTIVQYFTSATSVSIYPESSVLDERVSLKQTDKVNRIFIDNTEHLGDIYLVAGNNILFTAVSATAVEGKRKVNNIQISAVAGSGTGIYPFCPTGCVQTFIKTLNGVSPDIYGNMALVTKDCYWTGVSGISNGQLYQPSNQNTIDLNNNCSPCCECEDFVKTYKGIKNLYTKFKGLGDRSMRVRSQHYSNQDRWVAAKTCREEHSMKLFALPISGGRASMLVAYCNVSQNTIGPIRVEVNMASSTQASPEDNLGDIVANSVVWYPPKGGSPQVIEPEGEWPNYIFRWDSIAPGRSAKIRFNVEIPDVADGDLIQVNAQAILDSDDEILAEAPDYSLGLIP
jgi:hypothetical protein